MPWTKLQKPNDIITTTSIPHAKGKFMGILGLTYPGVSQTTTTTSTWNKATKPSGDNWNKFNKPTGSGWTGQIKPTD